MSTPAAPTVWFLTGSQGLYGPEALAQVEQQSRQIGTPLPIEQKDVDSLYARYQNVYGQEPVK